MLAYFANLLRGTQQAAGCIDVLSTAGTDGCKHAVRGKVIAELLHLFVIHALQWNIWNLMKADEVETAVQSLYQLDDCLGMLHAVIHSLEYDVFEREATLVGEVVVLQKLYHLLNTHTSFCRISSARSEGIGSCMEIATWHSLSSRNRFSLFLMPTELTVIRLGLHAQP